MLHGKYFQHSLIALVFVQCLAVSSYAQDGRTYQNILVETSPPYSAVADAIRARGGSVTHEYKFIDAIAATVPAEAVEGIRALAAVTSIDKDTPVAAPVAMGGIRARSQSNLSFGGLATPTSLPQTGLSLAAITQLATNSPAAYSLNNAGTRIEKLHAKGLMGTGKVVAVIDSGLRPGYRFLLGSRIVGGMDFVDDGPPGPAGDAVSDWLKNTNDGHGTFAAGLMMSNASFAIDGVLSDALQDYAPGALVAGKLPLVGTAPFARIYAVRVFGDNAAGAPKSTILAAIEHVIGQRELYDRSGGRQGVKIEVANLSLGATTLAAGRDLLDRSIDAMLKAGIVPVVSAGNTGPSALTVASPGSSQSAITVGGSSHAANERILNEVFYATEIPEEYYPGLGGDYRPYDGTEIAWFSSRGPNADGRLDPDVVVSSVGNLGQGYCPDQITDACFKRLSIASGTSFAAPIVSGIAAVLREAFPNATATQIRNAIIASGRTGEVAAHFDVVDRGQGLPDAWAAYELLKSGEVEDALPRGFRPDDLVSRNIEQNTDLEVLFGYVTRKFTGMKPGQRGEILYEVPPGTERVIVRIRNIELNGPQNPFYFGDALFLYVHSAKTSSIGASGDYLEEGFPFFGGEDEEFAFEAPDTGILRITLNPDTLNAGTVDAEVSVEIVREAWPSATFTNIIRDGKALKYNVEIKEDVTRADFLLTWDHDWAHYPTNDLDMYVCAPNIPNTIEDCKAFGIKNGATLAGPERVSVDNPVPGEWTVVVSGFNIPTGFDQFKLRVTKTR